MATLYARKESQCWPEYSMQHWENFDYSLFKHIVTKYRSNKSRTSYSDVIIMADTETSKKKDHVKKDNHICAWSIAFRAFGRNLVTLWGQSPRDLCECIGRVRENLEGDQIYIYWHNMSYDWIFIRRFMFEKFGFPQDQLNVKPLYPLNIKWANGIMFKDSLALAQRSLDKWAKDLQVETKKALGKWDYNKYRNQSDELSPDELLYIEHDVLAGVECIDVTKAQLHKTLSSLPLTATGIVRGEARNEGRAHHAHDWFLRIQPKEYFIQQILESVFHGGYTHANRYAVDFVWTWAKCFDFSSSYPFVLLTEKYPAEQFWKVEQKMTPEKIFQNKDYAFIFKITATGVDLKDGRWPMPMLSYAKCQSSLNAVTDNGRIMKADFIEIYMNEVDFKLFCEQYTWDKDSLEISECYAAFKDYLPEWFTDYVWERYRLKTELKGVDPVLYAIEKAKLNSCFGMCAQRPVKEQIREAYEDITIGEGFNKQEFKCGDFYVDEDFNPETEYEKFLNNRNSFLPYPVGVWCTAYAQANLFKLGKCVPETETWLYSDTDSVYATAFDEEKIASYNKSCIDKLEARGFKGIMYKDKLYYPGVAEDDGSYMHFKTLHSKCYCKRHFVAKGDNFIMGDDLQITVAGVPKKGAISLKNNIDNFKTYALFPGTDSGKLQHSHIFVDHIYVDSDGNLTGDSIDLSPCDYIIKDANIPDLDELLNEEVEVIDYEQCEIWDLL